MVVLQTDIKGADGECISVGTDEELLALMQEHGLEQCNLKMRVGRNPTMYNMGQIDQATVRQWIERDRKPVELTCTAWIKKALGITEERLEAYRRDCEHKGGEAGVMHNHR